MDQSNFNMLRLGAAALEAEYGVWNRVAPAVVSAKAHMDYQVSGSSLEKGPDFWMIQWKTYIDKSADNMVYLLEKIKDIASKIELCQRRVKGEYSEQDLKEIEYHYTYISSDFHWEEHQKEKAAQEMKLLKGNVNKIAADLLGNMKQSFLLQEEFPSEPSDLNQWLKSVKTRFDEIIDGIRFEEFFSDSGDGLNEKTAETLNMVIGKLEGLSKDLSVRYREQMGKDIPVSYVRKELSEWQELIRTEPSEFRKPQVECLAGGRRILGNYGLAHEDGAYWMDKKI